MFYSLKDKLQSVQEGITASFRGFSSTQPSNQSSSTLSTSSSPQIRKTRVNNNNYDVGAELLHKYQMEWSEIHQMTESNAQTAQELDTKIGEMQMKVSKKWNDFNQISVSLGGVPQLLNSVQLLMEQLGTIEGLFDEVEHSLFTLEDLIEIQELQERQLDHRFQLALYKEKKLSELEQVRASLATQHSDKLLQYELKQQKLLKERQETFGKAFEQDLEQYKQSGRMERLTPTSATSTPEHQTKLEDVTLELENTDELDQFLGQTSEC